MNLISAFYRSERRTGLKIIVTSVVLGALCATPLSLIEALGATSEAPTGAALLALFGTIAAAAGIAIGLVWLIVELLVARHR